MCGDGMGPDALDGLAIGSHVSGPMICGSVVYPKKEVAGGLI